MKIVEISMKGNLEFRSSGYAFSKASHWLSRIKRRGWYTWSIFASIADVGKNKAKDTTV